LSFSGNQYPNYADKVITTRGDIIRGDSSGDRARYGVGAANTVLTSDGTDPAWAAAALAPTTTKGDISGFSTTQARIPISTNNYSLFADSAQALGLKWAASPTSTLTTTGDLLAASAANVLTRIAGGDSGEILTGNGAGVLPTFQAASGASVSSDILVMDNSTTIGDYTQPASSTCSSIATETLTPDWTWDGTSTGWTLGTGCVVAGSQLAITNGSGTSRMAYRDLSADIGETWIGNTWVVRFRISGTGLDNTVSGQGWNWSFAIADDFNYSDETPSNDPIYAGNFNFAMHSAVNYGNRYAQAWTNSSTQSQSSADNFSIPITMTWYVQMVNDGTNIVCKTYTNSNYSDGLVGTETIAQTTPSDLQSSLKYLAIRIFTQTVPLASTMYVQDIKFWNDVTSAVTTQPCSNAIDDDVSTFWKSEVETNPNIYVDMSSATTTSNLALYPNSATTETEIKIQSSSNASDWTDQRTITYSNLSAGAWNYIRFNLVSARYWRIYGNSGSSYFLQIDEIKVLDSVSDADVRNLHGHISISSSDTSLNNAGT